MKSSASPPDPVIQARTYQLFREYFKLAEKKRRWSVDEDIPWDQCNPHLHGVVADVIETFCAVELYLPDYLSKLLPINRDNRGQAWFLANWGYEESKHSLVLGDWLLKSGHRSDEQLTDLNSQIVANEYQIPYPTALGMICYAMVQELATWHNYNHLRQIVKDFGGDPALEKVLSFIGVDERAHYDFFRKVVRMYLDHDREATLQVLHEVFYRFEMPALDLLSNGRQRVATIQSLKLFDSEVFFLEVMEPALAALGLKKSDLKRRRSRRELVAVPGVPDRTPVIVGG